MAIAVQDLLVRLDALMSDEDRVRWDVPERINWFNDAAREIVVRRPASRSVTQNITLAAGTLQQAPEGAAQVLDVIRNIKASGAPGRVVTVTDRQVMDRADPAWHSAKAGETRHYMTDDRSPTTFYVYPQAVAGATVEALLAVPPPEAADENGTIDMRAEFSNAIINWALYRCHTKDAEFANGAVATLHYQAFTDAIGAPAQAAQANSPYGNGV